MALEDYNRSLNEAGNNKNQVPDSILIKYILEKLPSDSLLVKDSLSELCRNFIGAEKLNSRIDSLKNSQTLLPSNLSKPR